MSNSFSSDILIQAEDPKAAAMFYVNTLGFQITNETSTLISLEGTAINLYIERGPALGPIFEVVVPDVDQAKARLLEGGCEVVKDEPQFPRCYLMDRLGLMYNLRQG